MTHPVSEPELEGLIPYPHSVQLGAGTFELGSGTVLVANGLEEIAAVFIEDMLSDSGIQLATNDSGPRSVIRLEHARLTNPVAAAGEWMSPDGSSVTDESYRLAIEPGLVVVSATAAQGIHRGLTTLRQLANSYRSDAKALIPAVTITDHPEYGWRGLCVDVARTFVDVTGVLALVDSLSLYKMNVLHLHLTDNDGWRIEIDGWPLLTADTDAKRTAHRTREHYSADDYREIVRYAAARFVTVVPEIDIPGHAESILREYPLLGVADDDGHGWLNPHSDETFRFVRDVLRQVADLTPGEFLHLGADEPFGMPAADYASFMRRVLPVASATGKRLVGWQEASRAGEFGFTALQCWIDRDLMSLIEGDPNHSHLTPAMLEGRRESFSNWGEDSERAVQLGAKIIVSPTSNAYLDVGYGEPDSDGVQEAERLRLGYSIYPRVDVREYADWTVGDSVSTSARSAVVGLEAAIWGETTDSLGDVQFLVLPRLPAIAQRGWSTDGIRWESYASALAAQEEVWRARGWNYFRSSVVFAPK